MRCFVDTSAFCALEDRADWHHASAHLFRKELRDKTSGQLITTNFVIDETLTLLKARLGAGPAIRFGAMIWNSEAVLVLRVSEEQEKRAWAIFCRYADKGFSFTDFTSFAVMKEEQIPFVFAFDRHFLQFGLKMVP